MKKVYMHTLNGKPAYFCTEYQEIFFILNEGFQRSNILRPDLQTIRREQTIDEQSCDQGWDRGYIGFYLEDKQ